MFWKKTKRLLFEHVPKCGGVSVSRYLTSNYKPAVTFALNGGKPHESIDHFRTLTDEQRSEFQLVIGHGAHQLLELCPEDTVAATILRDPIDRIVSHYYFVLASPAHYLYEQVTSQNMSLMDYATSGISGELRNNYVCRFLQIDANEAEQDAAGTLERVKQLLNDRYSVVGVLEHLDASMQAIRSAVGLRSRWVNERHNTTKKRKSIDEISDVERQTIAEVNALDVQLYQHVLQQAAT